MFNLVFGSREKVEIIFSPVWALLTDSVTLCNLTENYKLYMHNVYYLRRQNCVICLNLWTLLSLFLWFVCIVSWFTSIICVCVCVSFFFCVFCAGWLLFLYVWFCTVYWYFLCFCVVYFYMCFSLNVFVFLCWWLVGWMVSLTEPMMDASQCFSSQLIYTPWSFYTLSQYIYIFSVIYLHFLPIYLISIPRHGQKKQLGFFVFGRFIPNLSVGILLVFSGVDHGVTTHLPLICSFVYTCAKIYSEVV